MPFFILLTGVISLIAVQTTPVSAATSDNLNFQGRLLTNTGGMVPDGSYNIEFKIYDDVTVGTNLWTENLTGGNAVTVKNGYFSVYLGDVTPFGTSIPWDQDLWLTMNVNADGETTPRFKLTAVPYAFRAGAITDASGNAFTGDDLIQKSPSTIQAVNSALTAIRLNQAGAGGLLQLQGDSVDVFTVSKTGATTVGGPVLAKNITNSTSALDVQNVAGNSFAKVDTTNSIATFGSSAGTASTVLQGGSGGIQITSTANVNIGQADTNGTLLVVDTKTDAGDPPGTNGAIYYNEDAQKFRCYQNGAWMDCVGGAPYTGASVNYFSGAQNIGANQTAFPLENMVFTSATAVSNVAGVNGGFTAPADGSFRSCLVMNNANITAGTVVLRWRVNGVSVGSSACNMSNTAPTNRQSSTILNPGVVTFQAGDILDVAIDTSVGYTPTTNDYSVYWAVEYLAGSGGAGSGGGSLQDVYDQSLVASILTANNKDITFNLADTTIDSDFVLNIASGSTSRLVVQDNGTDTFSVNSTGNVLASGGLTVGNSSSTTAGTIRWTGTDFEGYDGANWVSLTSGSGGGGSGVNVVSRVKQVNESVISNNTPQDDNELTFPIGPNEEWSYTFVVQANAAAAADLRFAVTAPVGAVCNTATSEAENSASDAQVGCGVSSAILNGNGAPEMYIVSGRVQNGSTAGNVTLQWAQFTINATNTIVYAGSYVQAVRSIGAGGSGQPFAQDGNAFGVTAVLGTSDTEGLSIITDNTERIGVSSTGEVNIAGLTTLSGSLVANRTTTGVTSTTTGTGSNTTTLDLIADSFSLNDVVFIDNVGQDYYTRIVTDPGTGSYTVSPAITFENARTVTSYAVQNIGATSTDYTNQSDRFFQGYFLGGIVIGAGSTTIGDGIINSTTTLSIQANGGDVEFGNGNVVVGGGLTITGAITGDGSGLSNIDGSSVDGATIADIDASNITSGTLSDSRLSSNVALLTGSQTFSGAKTFGAGLTISGGNINAGSADITTAGQVSGTTIIGDGSGLTNLNASNIATGTLADGRLSANVALLSGSQTFSGAKTFSSGLTISSGNLAAGSADVTTTGQISGTTIVGDGSSLSNINASNISSGTIADARLSTNVAQLSGSQTFSGTKTFTSGLVLGLSTVTSSAAIARNVSLPDEAGTICLSNTNTCGYLRLAAGAAQTDASNNDVLAVNKTTATGNLINLQRSGGAVFTVDNSGALEIQSTGTTALDIRNASGSSYFTVDTSTGAVQVGPTSADGVGVLFVLDTKNDSGDPAIGTNNNAQYYNSADGKFRCYENGVWRDCIEPINNIQLMSPFNTSAIATNLALNTANCVSDPSLRMMMNLSGQSRLRFMARIGGTLVAATSVRIQYHLGGNPAVATGDAGWTTLATSAGGHTVNTLFYTSESSIPAGARTNNVLVRACLFSGNGAADPTISGVTINTYD